MQHKRRRQLNAAPLPGLPFAPFRGRQWPLPYNSIELVAPLADIVTILVASVIAAFSYAITLAASQDIMQMAAIALPTAIVFTALARGFNLYPPRALLELRHQVRGVCAIWLGVLCLLAVTILTLVKGNIPWGLGLIFGIVGLALLIVQRVLVRDALRKGLAERRFARRKIVLITDEAGRDLLNTLSNHGFFVEKHFTLPTRHSSIRWQEELIAKVITFTRETEVREILFGVDLDNWSLLKCSVTALSVLPLPIRLVPTGPSSDLFHKPSTELGSARCVQLQRGPLSPGELFAKRAIDLGLSTIMLTALSPLLLLVALAIKIDSSGPVIFRQQRCGFNGRPFTIYKFRSMRVIEDGPVILQATANDARLTRLGKWLRRTSIDEIPQLINVLEGNMSIVGPRPHAIAHDNDYDKAVHKYAYRRRVKPGLTGLAQIKGLRGPTPTPASIKRRVQQDLHYIDNWSIELDLMILIQTPFELLRGRNAI